MFNKLTEFKVSDKRFGVYMNYGKSEEDTSILREDDSVVIAEISDSDGWYGVNPDKAIVTNSSAEMHFYAKVGDAEFVKYLGRVTVSSHDRFFDSSYTAQLNLDPGFIADPLTKSSFRTTGQEIFNLLHTREHGMYIGAEAVFAKRLIESGVFDNWAKSLSEKKGD